MENADYPRCATCKHYKNTNICGLVVQIWGNPPKKDFGCFFHEPKPDWIEECAKEVMDYAGPGGPTGTGLFGLKDVAFIFRKHYNAAKERGDA